jgi:hypothetical protein
LRQLAPIREIRVKNVLRFKNGLSAASPRQGEWLSVPSCQNNQRHPRNPRLKNG